MEISGDIKEAKELFHALIKTKKTFRMYPQNNPIYLKTLQEVYAKFNEFLGYREDFRLKISQHSIYHDSQEIYQSFEKDENLALFFFKDGLRELNFKKGLTLIELEEFIKILSFDFERDAMDDDVVTLLWEKDFQNIQYVVDESYLVDLNDEEYGILAEEKAKERVTDPNDLLRAYSEEDSVLQTGSLLIVPLTERDLQLLVKELDKDASDKTGKLSVILFDLFRRAEDKGDQEEFFTFIRSTARYSMEHGDLPAVLQIIRHAAEILDDPELTDDARKFMKMLSFYMGTPEMIALLGDILDSGFEVDGATMKEFVDFLDKNAVEAFVRCLGELKSIHGRRNVLDALTALGRRDIQALSKGLADERWHVVRNIIYILRKIGDKRAVEYLLKAIRHGDIRVRKEVIKALGELGGREVVQTLRECLEDPEGDVRVAAAKAFASIGSEAGKRIIMDKISDKVFSEKNFDEKREFYEALSRWKDDETYEFFIKTMRKKSFFGRNKNDENRACAALGLGLLGNKEALPFLYKFREGNNGLLKDFSSAAIRRLEHGE